MDQQRIDILNGLKRELAESRVEIREADWAKDGPFTISGRLAKAILKLQSTVGGLLDALERREV